MVETTETSSANVIGKNQAKAMKGNNWIVPFWIRIKSGIIWRYQQFRFRPYVIDQNFAGDDFKFLIGDLFGQSCYRPKQRLWPELDWIKAFGIEVGDTVIDCGANHGFSTVLFSKWTGSTGKVIAFEPSTHNIQILHENLRLNELANVVCRQAAVGYSSGTVAITTHPNAAVIRERKKGQSAEIVPVIRLDDEVFSGRVAFIKIDVEGFELEVLKGAEKILESRPRLALELHVCFYQDKLNTLREIFELLNLNRYIVEIQRDVEGPIEPWTPSPEAINFLVSHDVVHLFCR